MKKVVVFGSINMDLVVRTERFPKPGETIPGKTFFTAPGGKGANQAVAAGRLGVPTLMVGRVGGDVFGETLVASLKKDGVDTKAVVTDPEQPSGTAVILVDDHAENQIVIVAGANGTFDETNLEQLEEALRSAGLLLLQLEVPLDSVVSAAKLGHEMGIKVILDPAPVRALPEELYGYIDIMTPNEHEASVLVGFQVVDEATAEQAARDLVSRGAGQAIIKMGGKGAYWFDGTDGHFLPAFKVEPVDTVAAGDAFNGGLAAGLSEGLPMEDALFWAMAAGAISTTRAGAQPSLANREELQKLLEQHQVTRR